MLTTFAHKICQFIRNCCVISRSPFLLGRSTEESVHCVSKNGCKNNERHDHKPNRSSKKSIVRLFSLKAKSNFCGSDVCFICAEKKRRCSRDRGLTERSCKVVLEKKKNASICSRVESFCVEMFWFPQQKCDGKMESELERKKNRAPSPKKGRSLFDLQDLITPKNACAILANVPVLQRICTLWLQDPAMQASQVDCVGRISKREF